MAEWYLFLPQVRVPVADIVERAQRAEASGFTGIAFIDHLEAPGLPGESIWEAMSVATWVAAKTERLRIGHLVLCDAFRHPAVLAKQAVTLSDASDWGRVRGRRSSPDSKSGNRTRRRGSSSSSDTSDCSTTTGGAARTPAPASRHVPRITSRYCSVERDHG